MRKGSRSFRDVLNLCTTQPLWGLVFVPDTPLPSYLTIKMLLHVLHDNSILLRRIGYKMCLKELKASLESLRWAPERERKQQLENGWWGGIHANEALSYLSPLPRSPALIYFMYLPPS